MNCKKSLMVLGMLFLAFAATWPAWCGLPLWLDSPTRGNPNDPIVGVHPHPTVVPNTNTPVPTFTCTPTMTLTSCAGCTDTDTPTCSATQTPSESFTSTPTWTPTSTITPLPTFSGVWYDGDGPAATSAFCGFFAGCAGGGQINSYEKTGLSHGGGANCWALTFTAAANTWDGGGGINRGDAPLDISAHDTLSMYLYLPDNTCHNFFQPMISLIANNNNDTSAQVTATAYMGTAEMAFNTWVQVQIPLTAFVNAGFPASDLQKADAVQFKPALNMYAQDGGLGSTQVELDVDDITFVTLGTAPASTGIVGPVFDDFENPWHVRWGWNDGGNNRSWEVVKDSNLNGPVTTITFPAVMTGNPVGAPGDPVGTSCHAGHLAGYLNANPPTGSDPWPYAQMDSFFSRFGYGWNVDLSNNLYINGLNNPGGGVRGLRMKMKLGAGDPADGTQVYKITIIRSATRGSGTINGGAAATGDWSHYFYQVNDYDAGNLNLNAATWTTFALDFPADGTPDNGNTGAPGDLHINTDASEVWWGRLNGTGSMTWHRNDLETIIISPKRFGFNFDIWVDDVEFY